MGNFKELLAYKKAFALAMKIFNLSKSFPSEERYSLTSQIRRSSRSVCANIAEAYRRRRFENYYISKLNDSETENSETDVWLDFAQSCLYISKKQHEELIGENNEVGKLIAYMIKNPDKFR